MISGQVNPTRDLKERVVRRFSKSPVALISISVIGLYALAALLVTLGLVATDVDTRVGEKFMSPNFSAWLGTDRLGRDILSRVIYANKIAFIVGLVTATLSVSRNNTRSDKRLLWRLARRSDRMALLHRRIDTVPFASHRNQLHHWGRAIWRILSICSHLLGCPMPSDPRRSYQAEGGRVCHCCSGDGIWPNANPISTYCTKHSSPLADQLYPDLRRGN